MWYPQAVVKAAWGYFFARLQKMPREPSRLPGQQEECMKQLFNFVDCYYLFSSQYLCLHLFLSLLLMLHFLS